TLCRDKGFANAFIAREPYAATKALDAHLSYSKVLVEQGGATDHSCFRYPLATSTISLRYSDIRSSVKEQSMGLLAS
ncbi:MAG: hypothetical protein AAGE03_00245, partial [Pseudomonadota bacterium]